MRKFPSSSLSKLAIVATALALVACSPKFDWREVRGTGEPFVIVMPAKPAIYSRPIKLDDMQVTMTMTAADVGDVTFAVGTAELPDAAKASAALQAMKTALINNIGGTVRSEKSSAATPGQIASIDIEALGAPSATTSGQPRLLVARFVAKDKRIYQAVIVGREKAVTREAIDTFFTSFKLD